jgi:hypothetical protein
MLGRIVTIIFDLPNSSEVKAKRLVVCISGTSLILLSLYIFRWDNILIIFYGRFMVSMAEEDCVRKSAYSEVLQKMNAIYRELFLPMQQWFFSFLSLPEYAKRIFSILNFLI